MKNAFPVIPIFFTAEGAAFVKTGIGNEAKIFILYDYIEGTEPGPEDTEKVGELIGQLHIVMKNYTGKLPVRDKHFFIDRYIEIMRKKEYAKAEDFRAHGIKLWRG
jgi:Ser/Thr protein kinase RdoA (MazF antagonist)